MRTIYKLFFIAIIIVSFSCQNDKESNDSQNQIAREWKLIKVTGGLIGVSQEINPGMIKWTFNSTTNTVTVINSTTDESLYDFFETGVYNYQIMDDSTEGICNEVLKIDGIELGCISFIDNKLLLNQSFADGFQLELID